MTRGSSASPFELFYKRKPSCNNELRTFGEMGVVADRKKIQGKLEDRGKVCMFVGYPSNHACDVYKMFNLQTMRVLKSRDIIWLKKSYGDWGKKVQFAEEDTSDEEELEAGREETASEHKEPDDEKTATNPKVIKEMKKLQSWFNPSAWSGFC